MEHMNLYTNSVYGTMGVSSQLSNITKFFINNRDSRIPLSDINEILKTKILVDTPMNSIFANALKSLKIDKLFTAVNVIDGADVPEAVTAPYITLDVLQLKSYDKKAYSAMSALPEFNDKIVINLTHLLRRKPATAVSDINELHSLYVRGLLIRSYYNSHNWLTPELIKYLSKSYSMTIGSIIARTYDLAYSDQIVVMTILTAYFHQLCHGDSNDTEWSPTIVGCSYLGDRMNIIQTLDTMKEKLGGKTELSISHICQLVRDLGPSRTEKFDIRKFYSLTQSLGTTALTAMISVEYPPYWTHQILAAFSGVKSGLYFAMKRNDALMKEGKSFADMLNKASQFIPSL